MQQPAHQTLSIVTCKTGGALRTHVACIARGFRPSQAHGLMRAIALTAARGGPLAVRVVLTFRVACGEVRALMAPPGATPRHAFEIVVTVILHQLLSVQTHCRTRTRRSAATECCLYAIVIALTFLEVGTLEFPSVLFLVKF